MEEDFKIRPYPKWQLAQMYFPITPTRASAVRNFVNLMKTEPELMKSLEAAGYTPHQKYFTPRQVRLISEVLGPP